MRQPPAQATQTNAENDEKNGQLGRHGVFIHAFQLQVAVFFVTLQYSLTFKKLGYAVTDGVGPHSRVTAWKEKRASGSFSLE